MSYQDQDTLGRSLTDLLKAKGRSRRGAQKVGETLLAAPPSRRNDLTPTLEPVQRHPQDLIIPARNVRAIDQAHVKAIAGAVMEWGFNDPVLIDEAGVVLDGVVRVQAAKSLNLDSIPCVVARHLTPAQKRQLRLAINRLQEKGSWDLPTLQLEMNELILEDISLEYTGFTIGEVDQITLDDGLPVEESGPLQPDREAVAVAKLGDIYALGQHRIVCGDARDGAAIGAIMSGEQARLIATDEPYNVKIGGHVTRGAHCEFAMASGEMSDLEFAAFNTAWMREALAFLCDGGWFGTFIDWRGLSIVNTAAVELGLTPVNLIVWAKTNAGMGSLYRSQHELFPLFKKGKAPHINNINLGKDGRWRSNLWTYAGASSMGSDARAGLRDHPTTKPVAMLEDALLDLTNRGDTVLDPFLGSGSTLIAAEKTGRRCRGLEIDPGYVDVVIRRWQVLTGREAILESTGKTFAQVQHEATGTDVLA